MEQVIEKIENAKMIRPEERKDGSGRIRDLFLPEEQSGRGMTGREKKRFRPNTYTDPFQTPPEKGDVDAEIRFIRGYVRLNPAASLTLSSVAKRVGLSPGYLCTMFRDATGVSFHKFVEVSRIERGAYLLETEDSLIEDIAKRVGFCSASHFISVFKNYYGMTPHIYRRKYRIEHRADLWEKSSEQRHLSKIK